MDYEKWQLMPKFMVLQLSALVPSLGAVYLGIKKESRSEIFGF